MRVTAKSALLIVGLLFLFAYLFNGSLSAFSSLLMLTAALAAVLAALAPPSFEKEHRRSIVAVCVTGALATVGLMVENLMTIARVDPVGIDPVGLLLLAVPVVLFVRRMATLDPESP